jgi:hypothetical protein
MKIPKFIYLLNIFWEYPIRRNMITQVVTVRG